MGTGVVRRLPDWVPLSVGMVRTTEGFLWEGYQVTESPELLGSWTALGWLAAPKGELSLSPLAAVQGWPSRRVAAVEMELAGELQFGAPYPDRWWWEQLDPELGDRLDEQWWAAHILPPGSLSFAHGVLTGLVWATGPAVLEVTALSFAPTFFGNGERVPDVMRERAAASLSAMWAACETRPS